MEKEKKDGVCITLNICNIVLFIAIVLTIAFMVFTHFQFESMNKAKRAIKDEYTVTINNKPVSETNQIDTSIQGIMSYNIDIDDAENTVTFATRDYF